MAEKEDMKGSSGAATNHSHRSILTTGPGFAEDKVKSAPESLKEKVNGTKLSEPNGQKAVVLTTGPGGANNDVEPTKKRSSANGEKSISKTSGRVRFAQTPVVDEGLTLNNLVPRKISVGNASTVQQVCIFGGILLFMLIAALSGGDIGKKPEKPSILSTKEMRKRMAKVKEEFKRIEDSRRRKTECGLFLGDSSITDAGLSWFAGRDYDTNDDVIEPGQMLAGFENIGLSHNGLFLKHHPFLTNVRPGDSPNAPFKATRPIEQGEELFLSYEDHPHSKLGMDHPLFNTIPVLQDYRYADTIFLDMAGSQLPQFQDNTKNRKIPKRGMMDRSAGGDKALAMLARAVAVLNPRVANLLPKTSLRLAMLFDVERDFVLNILENRTVYWLELNGRCMDDVAEKDGSIFARRPIEKGNTALVVQNYVTSRSDDMVSSESCISSPSGTVGACFGHADSDLRMCPIGLAASLKYAATGETNAVYNWGLWNRYGNKARKSGVHDIIGTVPAGITLDIVATRDIAVGEEIVVDISKDKLSDFGIEINDDDFPSKWTKTATQEKE